MLKLNQFPHLQIHYHRLLHRLHQLLQELLKVVQLKIYQYFFLQLGLRHHHLNHSVMNGFVRHRHRHQRE
jgi:hypothetical protein